MVSKMLSIVASYQMMRKGSCIRALLRHLIKWAVARLPGTASARLGSFVARKGLLEAVATPDGTNRRSAN